MSRADKVLRRQQRKAKLANRPPRPPKLPPEPEGPVGCICDGVRGYVTIRLVGLGPGEAGGGAVSCPEHGPKRQET